MVVQVNPKSKTAHLLLIVVQNHELSFDTIILSDKREKGNFNLAKREVALASLRSILV